MLLGTSSANGGRKSFAAHFDAEEAHMKRLVEFFRDVPDSGVVDFWEWDRMYNPQGLKEADGY
jgi:hypothetical protein